MAYIGNPPISGNFQVCDAISVVNGQAGYTMQVSSANVSPESANHMLVSLNGVLQKPGSSFTISGSTITFASNLATGDVIDFILLLGNVNDIGTPSDATVTDAKTNFVSTSSAAGLQIKGDGTTDGTLQLNCSQNSHGVKLKSPAHSASQSYTLTLPATAPATDKMLQTNSSGVLSFVDAPSGAMKLLHTATGSNVSSIDINGYFTSDYDHYKLIYSVYGASNNTDTYVKIMQGGSVVSSSNYWYAGMGMYRASGDTSANTAGSNGASYWRISSDDNTNNAQYPTTGEMLLSNPLSTTHNITMTTTNIGYNSASTPNAIRVWTFAGQYVDTGASSGVSFQYDGGNINGTIRLYGIVNS